MSELKLLNMDMLWLMWLLPLPVLLFVYAAFRRRRAVAAFIGTGMLGRIDITANVALRRWKAVLFILGFAAAVFALTRPGWNPRLKTIRRSGRDVVFIIDVSKSMLAEDLAPNRLERAKLAILDCAERLQGDRVALVAFAGTAAVKCPLTLDYGFFRMMVQDVSTDSIARGGTMIGDAVRKVLDEVFDDQQRSHKDIVLITDGEDHESFPEEAAKVAGEKGVRIIAVGLGDENEGQRIPVTDENGRKGFLVYKGREWLSRLDADTLKKMVNAAAGGRYYNVATGTIDLGDVYAKMIAAAEQKEQESKTIARYEEKFQIFLALGFVLLCVEAAMGDRARARRT